MCYWEQDRANPLAHFPRAIRGLQLFMYFFIYNMTHLQHAREPRPPLPPSSRKMHILLGPVAKG